jgi:hypothetical protein
MFVLKAEHMPKQENGDAFASKGFSCFNNLRELVKQCIAQSRLRFTDPEEVSQVLWACFHGTATLLVSMCGFPFIEQTRRLIDRVLDVTMEGVRAC